MFDKDDIIRMAREAGFGEPVNHNDWHCPLDAIERFAQLVAAAEREACAVAASDFLTKGRSPHGQSVAKAIRARGQQ